MVTWPQKIILLLICTINLISCSPGVSDQKISLTTISSSRMVTDNFYAGEKISFELKGVQVQSLFWIFNESKILKGPANFEYYFPYIESAPEGGKVTHRIDVFYKSGDTYKSAFFRFTVMNIRYNARLQFFEDSLFLKGPRLFDSQWALRNVSFTLFNKGSFRSGRSFIISVPSNDDPYIQQKLTEMSKNAFIGFIQQSGIAWVQYEFTARNTEQKLSIIEPLSSQNDLYNRPHPRLSNIFGDSDN